jgi:hypothetical protein
VKPQVVFVLWFVIGLVNNFVWLAYIKKRLAAALRVFSRKRYLAEARSSIWRRLQEPSRPVPNLYGSMSRETST